MKDNIKLGSHNSNGVFKMLRHYLMEDKRVL